MATMRPLLAALSRPAVPAARLSRQVTSRPATSQTWTYQSRHFRSGAKQQEYQRFGGGRQYQRGPGQQQYEQSPKQQQYQRGGFNYQRLRPTQQLLYRWSQSPTFYYQVAGIGGCIGGVYMFNLEEVPVSGRRRFNIISPAYERESGTAAYQQVMQQYGNQILPTWHPKHRMVQRVLDRLIPQSGLPSDQNDWELHVIDDPTKNAFVIPGGKVFVFAGILDVCQGEDGVAAVLGHEIAHNVAHHAAEKMSQSLPLTALAWVLSFALGLDQGVGLTSMVLDYVFARPNGRKQESEADYIGLMMMSQACYDPRQAMALWGRMEKEEQGAPPQFLSTHPSSHNRQAAIREWLPQAERKQEQSDCGFVSSYAESFRRAVDSGH